MNWLFFAILGHFFLALVFLLDKLILTKDIVPKPVIYAIYVGLSSLVWLPFLIPFAFDLKAILIYPQLIPLALLAGIIYVFGLVVFYTAVKKSDVSISAPLVGVGVAIFSLILSFLFLGDQLNAFQLFAFFLLVVGGFLISFKRKAGFSAPFGLIFLNGFLWSVVFVLMKGVYLKLGFLNAYIFFQSGFVLAGLILLLFRKHRQSVREHLKEIQAGSIGIFGLNKALAGIGFIFLNYAMFLGNVGLVQSLQGLQYAFLLILTIFLSWQFPKILQEEVGGVLFKKIAGVFLISTGLFSLYLGQDQSLFTGVKNYGVTFSYSWSAKLGLDPQQTYLAILDDLKVKNLRLPFYWSEIEKEEGKYNFDDFDWQINEAEKRGIKIIAAIGYKLPRWPECHEPEWARNQKSKIKNKKLLNYIETTVNRYKNSSAIWAWQVENEPFLSFGECPELDEELLDKEIALVRSLDPAVAGRPIIITESGELSTWHRGAKKADILGTTMYRVIWHPRIPFGGYLKYPLPPAFFQFKANIVKIFAPIKKIIVVELQTEPWGPKQLYEAPLDQQFSHFDFQQFKENINYVQKVGFPEVYFWGVEWWYWLKQKQNHPEFWEEARKLF